MSQCLSELVFRAIHLFMSFEGQLLGPLTLKPCVRMRHEGRNSNN